MDSISPIKCQPHGFLEFFNNFFKQPVSQVYQELTDKREGL